mmetsp:Transcript_9225/g.21992  ORF Transcript_9225/g.21992 Transcript_9225/m.21992 type:complete len:797 (+) Transcript_9225:2-2392(+)
MYRQNTWKHELVEICSKTIFAGYPSASRKILQKTKMTSQSIASKVASGPATLVDALRLRASETSQQDNHSIIYFEDGTESKDTLATLYKEAREYLWAMQSIGLSEGDYVLLQMPTRRKHFRVFWSCALGGIIPVTVAVPVDFRRNTSLLEKIRGVIATLGEVGQCVVLTEDSIIDPISRALNDSREGGTKTRVESMDKLIAMNKRNERGEEVSLSPDDVLFLQLTSGSTGIPKCIQETHRGITTQIVASSEFCGFAYGKTSLNWLPFDHVVPMLTTHLRDVYVGMRQVQIPTNEIIAEPLRWLDAMEKFKVNFSWSPNFGYSMVNQACKREKRSKEWNLIALESLINAGEQVTRSVCDLFITNTGICPTIMQPSFGMAESCTCITYCTDYSSTSVFRAIPESVSSVLQEASPGEPATEFMDLGPVVRGVEIRIASIGQPTVAVKENIIGRFQIKGPVVTPGYVNRPEANKEAFVGDGWFDSGDLGFIRKGRLHLTGRYKESICIRGVNLFCYEIESQAEKVPGVMATFVAATSIYSERTGTEELLIFFSPDKHVFDTSCLENDTVSSEIRKLMLSVGQKIAEATGISPKVCLPILPAKFHKTTSGKIQRVKFRKLFTEGHYRALLSPPMTIPSILSSGCYEHTWVPRAVQAPTGDTALTVRVVDPYSRSPVLIAIKEALEEASFVCVSEDPDMVLFFGALGSTPQSPVEAVSESKRVLAYAAEVLAISSDTAPFFSVTSAATDMDRLVGASLQGFVRSLACEEHNRKATVVSWDGNRSSLPSLFQAIRSPSFFRRN